MTGRVALEVTPELVGSTGVARYSRALAAALEQHGGWEIVRFAVGRQSVRSATRVRRLPVPLRVVHPLWKAARVPRAEWISGPVDVVHSVDLIAPPTRRPLVVTVHDLAALELPDLHPPRTVAMQRRRIADLHRADAVLAVSEATADALVARGVSRHRIHVTPLGLTPLGAPIEPVGLPAGRVVLVVGTLEPRKGHVLLLQAMARPALRDVVAVFAGPTAGRDGELRAAAARLGLGDRLVLLGAVDDRRLAGLYRRASAVCMPSLAEGFGLPLLEAMSTGVPLVASDLPVVWEVAGECAVRFGAGDAEALATALERALDDDTLRDRLAEQGPERAQRFTWARTAAATVTAYEAAVTVHSSRRTGAR